MDVWIIMQIDTERERRKWMSDIF